MMKNIRLSALLLAALSGSLMAQTVATVNGKAIDSSEIDAVVQNLKQGNPQLQDGPQLREEITRRLVVSTAVAQEAHRVMSGLCSLWALIEGMRSKSNNSLINRSLLASI